MGEADRGVWGHLVGEQEEGRSGGDEGRDIAWKWSKEVGGTSQGEYRGESDRNVSCVYLVACYIAILAVK